MDNLRDLDAARIQSLRRWSENGVDEIMVGLMSCLFGLIYMPRVTSAVFGQKSAMAAPFLQIAICLTMVPALKWVRVKLIFPRTGYVVFRQTNPGKGLSLAMFVMSIGAAIAVYLVFLLRIRLPDLSRLWAPGFAIIMAACFLWGGIGYELMQFLWFAGYSLILGGVIYATGAKMEGVFWEMIGIGAVMIPDGAWRLRRFLRTHPVREDHDA